MNSKVDEWVGHVLTTFSKEELNDFFITKKVDAKSKNEFFFLINESMFLYLSSLRKKLESLCDELKEPLPIKECLPRVSRFQEKIFPVQWISLHFQYLTRQAQLLTLLGKQEELKELLNRRSDLLTFSNDLWVIFSSCLNKEGAGAKISEEFSIGLHTFYQLRTKEVHRSLFLGENHTPFFLVIAESLVPHFGAEFWKNYDAYLEENGSNYPERIVQAKSIKTAHDGTIMGS